MRLQPKDDQSPVVARPIGPFVGLKKPPEYRSGASRSSAARGTGQIRGSVA